MRALFDVNVLIALNDLQHVHHGVAADWFDAHGDAGWATCPLTQNGLLSIMSQPGYPQPETVGHLLEQLRGALTARYHEFWPDDVSLTDAALFRADRIHGHRQLTDLYLLGLAVRHGGRLVTFDTRIRLNTVVGAGPGNLVTLPS